MANRLGLTLITNQAFPTERLIINRCCFQSTVVTIMLNSDCADRCSYRLAQLIEKFQSVHQQRMMSRLHMLKVK